MAALPEELASTIFTHALTHIVLSRTEYSSATSGALHTLQSLAEDHILSILDQTMRITNHTRRQRPTLADLERGLRSLGILPSFLEDELLAPPIPPLPLLAQDNTEPFEPERQMLRDPVPVQRGQEVPDWMPAYPSAHTYLQTPIYPERVTDPRVIREKVSQEARIAEDALRRLIRETNQKPDMNGAEGVEVVGADVKKSERKKAWEAVMKEYEGPDGAAPLVFEGVVNWETEKLRKKA
ncbi:hypothetical protein SAICODRAFT_69616 [Saitoella complicata NRRL Y-17804]|uniref:uncharacterized protein n=1 Tax=Saitoella complicata (strain BCRC 22490 / CBS 7301 / JCM 7358 / NBRC 10748 / NRRL Y-17804) TaxID=698492 RepID=UPI000866D585|nr:uncharacterized protein SAICODRAFT_69616 [Saitoella complicata NRRL Y-17804]ODQ54973.1 hypothetical protein SAICODRAFT_69616 [Saitoella complicata NRRL Y-17804]